MTIEDIKDLIQVFKESGVGEMEVQRGENRLRLARATARQDVVTAAGMPSISAFLPTPLAAPASTPSQIVSAGAEAVRMATPDANHVLVKSPIVGTYYDQASPEAPPFVRVGDSVEPGEVLCIIESMKLMNEIEAEVAGIVAAKLIENGRPVEYGEALFAIQPR